MTSHRPDILVAALYRFARLENWRELRAPLAELCKAHGVKGTLLLAHEGINGTIAGSEPGVAAVVGFLERAPALAGLEVKYSRADETPFHRMKVRLKREIVTMGVDNLDPRRDAGRHVAPADWNGLIADPGTVVIDARNSYEIALGTFAGAIDPGTASFSEFPRWLDAHREELRGRRIAMFCTGGIRCEKATAYARSLGLEEVFHLKGGILKYLEETPADDSLWRGECFVFDERVAVGHGLRAGEARLCRACRHPLTPEDLRSPQYVEGVSCRHCRESRGEADRARYAERQRQVELAGRRGRRHIGG